MKIIKLSKRLLSFILAIAIITSLLPMSMVFADTTDLDTTSPVLKVYKEPLTNLTLMQEIR